MQQKYGKSETIVVQEAVHEEALPQKAISRARDLCHSPIGASRCQIKYLHIADLHERGARGTVSVFELYPPKFFDILLEV